MENIHKLEGTEIQVVFVHDTAAQADRITCTDAWSNNKETISGQWETFPSCVGALKFK